MNVEIAVDKGSIKKVKFKKDVDYIYLFEDESLDDLLNTNLRCLHYKYCDFVDINLTRFNVDCLKQASVDEKDYDKLPGRKDFKIGIVIPNYNYEHCLEKCLTSILNQTYTNYEIVFVDDVSTDCSVAIAKKLLKPPHKIIELKQKRLNGGARNEAYLHFSEDVDYIYYVDSDDWLANDNVLEKIVRKLQHEPDVLFIAIDSYKRGVTRRVITQDYKDKYEAMQGWSGSCGKVIKKELATRQDCLYNEGTLKEDRNQHWKICLHMRNFECMKESVYVWNRDNYKSVTTIRDEVLWGTSTIRHYADTLQLYLTEKGKDKKIDEMLKKRVEMTKAEMEGGRDRQW